MKRGQHRLRRDSFSVRDSLYTGALVSEGYSGLSINNLMCTSLYIRLVPILDPLPPPLVLRPRPPRRVPDFPLRVFLPRRLVAWFVLHLDPWGDADPTFLAPRAHTDDPSDPSTSSVLFPSNTSLVLLLWSVSRKCRRVGSVRGTPPSSGHTGTSRPPDEDRLTRPPRHLRLSRPPLPSPYTLPPPGPDRGLSLDSNSPSSEKGSLGRTYGVCLWLTVK